MTALTVERTVPIQFSAMRMTPGYLDAIFGLATAALEKFNTDPVNGRCGWIGKPTPVTLQDGSIGWQMVIAYGDDQSVGVPTPLTAHSGYWIFPDHELNVEVLDPVEAVARYQSVDEIPFEWDAVADAGPTVTVGSDDPTVGPAAGTLRVTVRQPKSLNAPWSWAVQRRKIDNGMPGDPVVIPIEQGAEIISTVRDDTNRVIGGEVAFDIPTAGMDVEDQYTFAIQVTATRFNTVEVSIPSGRISLNS